MTSAETPRLRERIAWAVNDVANSAFALVIVTAVYPLYFSGVVVPEDAPTGRGDALWGYGISASMALVALSSPLMGALADHRRWRKHLLLAYTLVGGAATAGLGLVGPGMVGLGLLLLVVGNVAFEGSLVFYDALLPGVAPRERIGRWSGIGWASGYLGSLGCLFACVPLVEAERFDLVFALVGAWWVLWSLPLFLVVRDRAPTLEPGGPSVWRRLAATFRRIRGNRHLSRFFVAFFLYNDGIATTIAFASLYASKTLGFGQSEIMMLLAAVQVSAAVGAFLLGFVADRIGHGRTISMTLVVWCGVVLSAYLVTEKSTFWAVAIAVGFVMGATQSASRGFLAAASATGESGELFGFKAVAGKFSAVLGPLVFGAVSEATGSQRLAVLAVGAFFVVGLLLMLRVDEDKARL
ncbi:MAG: MFS transporter [Myxococcota bacterium]